MTPAHKKPKIVCPCLGVTEEEILEAFRTRHIKTLKDIAEYTQAGEGCTACHEQLLEYLDRPSTSRPPHRPSAH